MCDHIEDLTMKTMIKYRGGKTREIPLFEKYFPDNWDTYFEPFFGGGAVFFYLEPSKSILNDVNSRLANFYIEVRDKFDLVHKQLSYLQSVYKNNQITFMEAKEKNPIDRIINPNENLYYRLRDMFNHKTKSEYLDSVLYYFINKTAYSGMIRYNKNGEYNVPFGHYKNFNTDLVSEPHSNLLKKSSFLNGDYKNSFDLASSDDFMFLDPPYDCTFNDYGNYISSDDGFNELEHRRLASDFKKLSCKTLMIIGKTKLTEELYSKYIKEEYDKTYSVNIRNRFKSLSKHLIVSNY